MEIDKEKLERIIRDIENGIGDTYLDAVSNLKELIEEPKWEPKGGGWRVYGYGRIDNTSGTAITYRKFGFECQTKELAEKLRDMTHRNNLIFQLIHEKGWSGNYWHVGYDRVVKRYVVYANIGDVPENGIDTPGHAQEVIRILKLNDS